MRNDCVCTARSIKIMASLPHEVTIRLSASLAPIHCAPNPSNNINRCRWKVLIFEYSSSSFRWASSPAAHSSTKTRITGLLLSQGEKLRLKKSRGVKSLTCVTRCPWHFITSIAVVLHLPLWSQIAEAAVYRRAGFAHSRRTRKCCPPSICICLR